MKNHKAEREVFRDHAKAARFIEECDDRLISATDTYERIVVWYWRREYADVVG